jgi:hypothetical protein
MNKIDNKISFRNIAIYQQCDAYKREQNNFTTA